MADERLLIVGLGNPGRKYADTRHNVGFQIVSMAAERRGVAFTRTRANALVCDFRAGSKQVVLAKPQTYMNNSGSSVAALVNFYKLDLANLLVVFDDADLPVGAIRIRAEGGHGGQNGMRSIITHIGDQGFPRMRIGVGRPRGGGKVAGDYVLKPFSKAQAEVMDIVLPTAVDAIDAFIDQGLEYTMNSYNKVIE